MSDGQQGDSDKILHQDAVEEVIEDVIIDSSGQAALVNLPAVAGVPTQAEHNALVTRTNVLTQVLRDLGAIPSA